VGFIESTSIRGCEGNTGARYRAGRRHDASHEALPKRKYFEDRTPWEKIQEEGRGAADCRVVKVLVATRCGPCMLTV
jgi:hypothetical protein